MSIGNNNPHIGIFTVGFPSQDGGIASYAMGLARGLTRKNIPLVVLASVIDPKDKILDQSLPFPVIRYPRVRVKPLNFLYRCRALYQGMKRYDLQFILATDWYGVGTIVWLFNLFVPLRYVVIAHGNEILMCKRNPRLRWICRRVLSTAQNVIAASAFIQQLVKEVVSGITNVISIPNGVDPSDLDSTSSGKRIREEMGLEEKKIILSLGRLVARKGHDMMIRALPEIIEAVPEAFWIIAGKGSYEGHLRKMVNERNLQDHVRFVGYVDGSMKGAYYRACDVYALVSRTIEKKNEVEGFGITYLEASLCGKPILAGRSGGVEDAVEHEVTGFLVDPENPNEIAKGLISLLTNADLAQQLGRNGRERVLRSFTWDHYVERLLAEIEF